MNESLVVTNQSFIHLLNFELELVLNNSNTVHWTLTFKAIFLSFESHWSFWLFNIHCNFAVVSCIDSMLCDWYSLVCCTCSLSNRSAKFGYSIKSRTNLIAFSLHLHQFNKPFTSNLSSSCVCVFFLKFLKNYCERLV